MYVANASGILRRGCSYVAAFTAPLLLHKFRQRAAQRSVDASPKSKMQANVNMLFLFDLFIRGQIRSSQRRDAVFSAALPPAAAHGPAGQSHL